MGPHANYQHRSVFLVHFVDEAVLEVDAPRIRPTEFTLEGFVGRGILKGIVGQYTEQRFNPSAQFRLSQFLGVLLCVLAVVNCPAHHFNFLEPLRAGVFRPFLMDVLIPGMALR